MLHQQGFLEIKIITSVQIQSTQKQTKKWPKAKDQSFVDQRFLHFELS